ncbi:D-glycero-alpha-D-manno-heptose 1-phosphate guanylyltransferase [Aneurinibacillus soli]|uniref:D-glycero-alpha-D-manno-heptose 1-phosphate guanylyltransferase n=1 Tax=Aneurinibacillus soli TaxID=1500254 RepID=A0A0U4WCF4_9BACL|nr:nucleotidyltransferase family protein [Aneurinibacillus soli]PYE61538.1 D-glycero-alpha-D-manno-heptose 1-phosphate guanylyltransferase [Aneurinibacillus soli]BAU26507.1 D-glycero-alpha-D-manno-heptose 1-phosphate guanylyltransferase [Aneurinibacillus soli]
MEAIVLAGGLGTRLRSVISDVPKPMAPIDDKPFLHYILHYLAKQGINRVILSTGYKHEVIEAYFGYEYCGMSIVYSVEDEPLGTGGAIKRALEKVTEQDAFIMNGDTFFAVDLQGMIRFHQVHGADITIALKRMEDFSRYGAVMVENGRVRSFQEKGYHSSGNINGGIYIINKQCLEIESLPNTFSFESDVLEKFIMKKEMYGFISEGYFIDIGIPEDYEKAQGELHSCI